MRIVTWNLEFDKAAGVWPSLQSALAADIVLLQETRRPDWRGGLAWEKVAGRDWGSAVLTTKGTICSLPIVPCLCSAFTHRRVLLGDRTRKR